MSAMNNAPVSGASLDLKKTCYFILAIVALLIIYFLPTPEPIERNGELLYLTSDGKTIIGILVFALILWITEAIPFAVTGLLLPILIYALGVENFKEVVRIGFGNDVLLFLMGAMGLSSAMTASGLAKRIMLTILSKVGRRTDYIVLAFIATGTCLSMWITDMAVAAMLLPLGVSILKDANCEPLKSNFGRSLMIGIVWGALIGGTATPAGCGPNILAIEYIRTLANIDISFFDWMVIGIPGAMIMVPLGWIAIIKIFPPEFKEIPSSLETIHQSLHDLGSLTRKEKNTIVVFITMVTFWVFGSHIEDLTGFATSANFVGICGFTLLFLPGLRVFENWKEAASHIDWGGLVLIAGGISAGVLLSRTGSASWIASVLLSDIAAFNPIMQVMLIITLVEGLKIFLSSNNVTGAIIIPLIIALALDLNIHAWVLTGPAAIASSMGFLMVTSTPTNIIPYSAGYFSIQDFAKAGVVMTIIAILSVTASVAIFGRFGQLNIWG